MCIARKVSISGCKVFEDIFLRAWRILSSVCIFQQLDIVYDSYIKSSIKYCERQRRATADSVFFYNLNLSSYVPGEMEKFWACDENKENLQYLSRSFFKEKCDIENIDLILSGTLNSNSTSTPYFQQLISPIPSPIPSENLNKDIEEADLRIIPHIENSILSNTTRIIVVSNDTDVVVLILYYMHYFFSIGLVELWIQFGVAKSRRFIPLHILAKTLGEDLCSVLIKAHIFTGCDYTSKVGTKSAAVKSKPELYLMDFGNETSINEQYSIAEKYLVNFVQKNSQHNTFNELRYEQYFCRRKQIADLSPTSVSIRGHLKRCYYVTYMCINLLKSRELLDPLSYGWHVFDGGFYPDQQIVTLPVEYTILCNCATKCTGRCRCLKNELSCTKFCRCFDSNCSNT